jgi:hypothetical protein
MFTAVTVRIQQKPRLVKAAYRVELQTLLDKKIAKAARTEREDSVRVARVDEAHKSERGHRGGNLGNKN